MPLIDPDGAVLAEALPKQRISEALAEAVEPWTYLKFPHYKPLGPEAGSYRVGPLARLNVCERIGTERADAELLELRERGGRVVTSSFKYHLARLIESLAALEAIELLLNDPEICATQVRAHAGVNAFEALNLIIATGQDNRAMNRTVTQIARQWIPPGAAEISEGLLNRVEAGIRCFDPCLSCSTHAAGQMPLHVHLIGANGELLQERWRQ